MELLAIFGTAVAGLLALVVGWLKSSAASRQGAAVQRGEAAEASAASQAAIAAAMAEAPSDQAEVVARLNEGRF